MVLLTCESMQANIGRTVYGLYGDIPCGQTPTRLAPWLCLHTCLILE